MQEVLTNDEIKPLLEAKNDEGLSCLHIVATSNNENTKYA